jgi:hypothetical protein
MKIVLDYLLLFLAILCDYIIGKDENIQYIEKGTNQKRIRR